MVQIRRMFPLEARSYCQNSVLSGKTRRIIVHHTWSPTSAQYAGLSTVQAIQRWHTAQPPNGRGWSDIGYHLLVAPDGSLYNGRPMNTLGAHTAGQNQHIGIACIANFDVEDPWAWGGLGTLRACINILLGRLGLGVGSVHFHREYADKTCPGTKLDLGKFRAWLNSTLPADPNTREVVLQPAGTRIPCHASVESGVTRGDVRILVEALGFQVVDKPDQGEVWILQPS